MTNNYLELHNVNKTFANFSLENISFSLPRGFIMGLIGSNGAGKTTTINLILNMLEKEHGQIEIFGQDHLKNEKQIKQGIGVVFDSNFFVDTWTVAETEKAISIFYDKWNHETYQELIKKFKLPANAKVGELSRGMQMKLMLACAFSHDAKLLILDEPTSGLDPVTRNEFLEILQDYIKDGERSVLFSTHITTDLERVADYITYLEHGKLLYTGSMGGLLEKYFIIKGAPGELTNELKRYIIGLRQTDMGFQGLISADQVKEYRGYILDKPTIDDIIIHISKEER
ncbi:ABC transporter ATP-binding protein [Fusibacter bizertensis]